LDGLPPAERAAATELLLDDFVVEPAHVTDPSLVFEGYAPRSRNHSAIPGGAAVSSSAKCHTHPDARAKLVRSLVVRAYVRATRSWCGCAG
jgi:hypothetical protein